MTRDHLAIAIGEVFQECQRAGWDGYDGLPVTVEAREGALEFLKALPERVEDPEVVPEADGLIAFEWDRGKNYILSVSVDGRNLCWAGIFRSGRHSGAGEFEDGLPKALLALLEDFLS